MCRQSNASKQKIKALQTEKTKLCNEVKRLSETSCRNNNIDENSAKLELQEQQISALMHELGELKLSKQRLADKLLLTENTRKDVGKDKTNKDMLMRKDGMMNANVSGKAHYQGAAADTNIYASNIAGSLTTMTN